MSPDRRRLVIWAGCGAAVIAAGFAVLFIRGSAHEETLSGADSLHAGYVKHYHPDKPEGFAIEQARTELQDITAKQAGELATAEGSLAPPLAAVYLVESLSEAAAQVTADYSALRQLSARTRIGIPASLPFESGLDADAKARARQLAGLALIRQAVQTCMHAGVARINNVVPGQPFASPGGEYAVFAADLEVEADWAATARLVAAFAQADGRGLGLRSLEVASGGADKPLRTRLTATLTTTNREAWGLGAMPVTAPAATAPAGGGESGGRLRRLGGARP
jgi:hypothetical protein